MREIKTIRTEYFHVEVILQSMDTRTHAIFDDNRDHIERLIEALVFDLKKEFENIEKRING